MDGIGGVIIFIIIMIVSSIAKSQKNAKKQPQQKNTSNRHSNLQSQLNRAMRQIDEIKNVASENIEQTFNSQQNTPKTQNKPASRPTYRSSLEGHKVEGYKVEGYQMEGAKVEGHKVEGIKRSHNTSKFNKNKVEFTESSMKRGYAGEGCEEHYDMEILYSKAAIKKSKKKSLNFSNNPIVQGVVMAQILERPRR